MTRVSLKGAASAMALVAATLPAFAWAQDTSGAPSPNPQTGAAAPQPGTPGQTDPAASVAPQQASGEIADIVVTARFKTERVQDTPLAITALTGDTLAAKGASSLGDVSGLAPNVVLQTGGTNSGKSLQASIRGIGQTDFNFALEPGVGVYLDDVYYGTIFGSVLDLADIDRVEVLRGPQGTLFGRNSEGGAVRVYNTKPRGDNSGYVTAGYGSYNRFQVRGAIDLSIVPDLLALRVSGGATSSDGFVKLIDYTCRNPGTAGRLPQRTTAKDCQVGTLGGQDAQYVRAALRYTPTSDLEINLAVSHNRDNGEATPETVIAIPGSPLLTRWNQIFVNPTFGINFDERFLQNKGFYETYLDFRDPSSGLTQPNKASINETVVSGTIDLDSGIGHVRSITGYRHYTGGFSLSQGGSPIVNVAIYNPVKNNQFTQEVTLTRDATIAGLRADFTLGAFYYHNVANSYGYVNLPVIPAGPGGIPLRFTQDNEARSESYSGFAHANVNFTEALALELGYRWTHDSKSFALNQYFIDTTGRPTTTPQTVTPAVDAKNNRSDYRVGLSYKLTPDALLYGTFATGYKPGGSNPRPLAAADVVGFGPESVNSYELGGKFEFLNRRVRFNTAVFQSDYKDLQVQGLFDLGGGLVSTRLGNFGKVRIRGVEGELTARATDAWTIDATIGYLDYSVREVGAATGISASSRPATVPDWTASAGTQYVFDLGSSGTLTPRIDWRYQSSNVSQPLDETYSTIPARSLFNGQITYVTADRLWSATLAVNNILNKKYYISKLSSVVPFGTADGQPGAPRMAMFTVKRTF